MLKRWEAGGRRPGARGGGTLSIPAAYNNYRNIRYCVFTFIVIVMYFVAVHSAVGIICSSQCAQWQSLSCLIVNKNKLDRLPIFHPTW